MNKAVLSQALSRGLLPGLLGSCLPPPGPPYCTTSDGTELCTPFCTPTQCYKNGGGGGNGQGGGCTVKSCVTNADGTKSMVPSCGAGTYVPSFSMGAIMGLGQRLGSLSDATTLLNGANASMNASPSDPTDAAMEANSAAQAALALFPNDPALVSAAGSAYVYSQQAYGANQNGQDPTADATNAISFATAAVKRAQALSAPAPVPGPAPAPAPGPSPAPAPSPVPVSSTSATNWTPWIVAGVLGVAGAAAVIGINKYGHRGLAHENPTRPSTHVQTLIFPKAAGFTASRATSWANQHGYVVRKIDETGTSYRIRQRDPSGFKKGSFRTIAFGDSGVKAVVGRYRG